jgi:hypothetical protein
MADKMICPGCDAESSSILTSVRNGEPCPFCGLSAEAISEIQSVRQVKADEDLKDRLEKALVERDHALAEAAKLRSLVASARMTLGCEYPYAPHDAIKDQDS